jgi:hypothetical protein
LDTGIKITVVGNMTQYNLVDIKVLGEPSCSLKKEAAGSSETLVPDTKLRDIIL